MQPLLQLIPKFALILSLLPHAIEVQLQLHKQYAQLEVSVQQDQLQRLNVQ